MANTRTFTAIFDIADRFTSKFHKIQNLMERVEQKAHIIDFDIREASVIQKTQQMEQKVTASAAGMQQAVNKVTESSISHTDAVKRGEDAVKKGTDATTRHKSAIEGLSDKYKNLSGTVNDLKDNLAGMLAVLTGGAIATLTWKAAEEGAQYYESVMDRLSKRRGTKKIDMPALDEFVQKAVGSGYTSTTDRLQLANTMVAMGARNTKQAIGATDAIEKIFFKERTMLAKDYGITSAEGLARVAAKEKIDDEMRDRMDYLFGRGFSKRSQASRIRILGKMGQDIDIDEMLDERPLDAMITRIFGIGEAIGNEFRGPLNGVARLISRILSLFDGNPIATKFLAAGIAVAAVAGGLLTIVGLLPMLSAALSTVVAGFGILGNAGMLAGLAGFLLTPIGLLAALGAILVIVAVKTGVLQKAWDKFTGSAIGKDVISGVKGLSDVVGGLINRFGKWYEASGKNQMLEYFFKFVEVLGYAWEYIDKIYSTMRSGGANPLLTGFVAMQAIPAALAAGAFKAATGKDPGEALEGISGYLSGLFNLARSKLGFLDKIHDIMKRVQSILDWIFSSIQSMVGWLRDGLGITKSQREKAMNEYAEKKGLTYLEKSDWSWFKGPGWYKNANSEKGELVTDPRADKLRSSWQESPKSFFDSFSGIPEAIAEAVKGAFPDFSGLMTALNELVQPLKDLADTISRRLGGGKDVELPEREPDIKSKFGKAWSEGNGLYTVEIDKEDSGWPVGKYERWGEDDLKAVGFASGLTVTKGGRFTGRLHDQEQLISSAGVRKGPGILERAMNDLDSIMTGRAGAVGAGAGSGSTIHLHLSNEFDFSGSKFSSDIDTEKFFKSIEPRIRKTSIDAVRDHIGKRR